MKKEDSRVVYEKRRPGDRAQVYANIKKFKRTFKWKPKYINNIKKILLKLNSMGKKLKSLSNVKKK